MTPPTSPLVTGDTTIAELDALLRDHPVRILRAGKTWSASCVISVSGRDGVASGVGRTLVEALSALLAEIPVSR